MSSLHTLCTDLHCVVLLLSCSLLTPYFSFFFFNDTATTEIYTLSLHDALPISTCIARHKATRTAVLSGAGFASSCMSASVGTTRSEEHTSELQSLRHLVCRLLLEKKKTQGRDYERMVKKPPHCEQDHALLRPNP